MLDPQKQIKIEREVAKLLHGKGSTQDSIGALTTSIVNHVNLENQSKATLSVCNDLSARSILSVIQVSSL